MLVVFCVRREMFFFVVIFGDDYKNIMKGLFGMWNDNVDDDFILFDGMVLVFFLILKEIYF